MIAGLKRYPEYKESDLPWLRQVPVHWEMTPNRGLIRRRKVLVGKRHCNYQLLSLTKLGIIVRDVASGKGKFSSDMGTSQEVRVGDLVFCFFDIPETPRTVGLSSYDGMITGAYTVFECFNPKSAGYFELFYRAMDDRKLLSPLYSGLRKTIPPSRFLGTKTPQPSLEEQVTIARFLNWSNKRLERAIQAKRKVIGLLNEQKQAKICRAVTRGLNPNVALKSSGISWLGEVPRHWDIGPGLVGLREKQEKNIGLLEKKVLSLSYGRIIVKPEGKLHGLVPESFETYQIVSPGDIIIRPTDLQNDHTSLRVGLVKDRGIITSAYICLQPLSILLNEYAYQLLNSYDFLKVFYGLGSGTRQNLGFSDFKRLPLLFPPKDEQTAIVAFIEKEVAEFLPVVKRLEREIELLMEYRTRLTFDVVAGKLDVRSVAKSLPEESAISIQADSGEKSWEEDEEVVNAAD